MLKTVKWHHFELWRHKYQENCVLSCFSLQNHMFDAHKPFLAIVCRGGRSPPFKKVPPPFRFPPPLKKKCLPPLFADSPAYVKILNFVPVLIVLYEILNDLNLLSSIRQVNILIFYEIWFNKIVYNILHFISKSFLKKNYNLFCFQPAAGEKLSVHILKTCLPPLYTVSPPFTQPPL